MLQPDFSVFPVLQTPRLTLRRIVAGDVPAYFALRSDPEVARFTDRPLTKTTDEIIELLQKIDNGLSSNDAISWAITLRDSGAFVGVISFWRMQKEHFRAEIGYSLAKAYWRKGFATESVKAVLGYGFGKMKLHSVEANVNPANQPSIALLEKCGFTREAYFRENYFFNGTFFDSAIYSLLAQDWASSQDHSVFPDSPNFA